MDLEDRFYPDDGTLINKYDNFMIRRAGNIGSIFQECTGESYKEQVKISFGVATMGMACSTLMGCLPSFLYMGPTLDGYLRTKMQTPLEEEIDNEMRGFLRKGQKYARVAITLLSPSMIIPAYFKFSNQEDFSFISSFYIGFATTGVSMIPWLFGSYLSLAQMPKTPKKTIFERAKDYLLEAFPSPVQVPIRV